MNKIVRVKSSQAVRVIINGVCFNTTAKQIRAGVGDFYKTNAALQKSLDSLEHFRSTSPGMSACVGHAGTWEGMSVQLNLI